MTETTLDQLRERVLRLEKQYQEIRYAWDACFKERERLEREILRIDRQKREAFEQWQEALGAASEASE